VDRKLPTALATLVLLLAVVSGCAQTTASATPTVDRTGSPDPTPSVVLPNPAATPARTPALNATPPPAPISAAAAAAPCLAGTSSGPFLRTQGASITCDGRPVPLTGYTFYPSLLGGAKAWHDPAFPKYIDHILDMGAASGQNLIRATDQWDRHAKGQTATDPVVWANMDYLLTAARKRGVFVAVDLSAFRWLLMSQGKDPSQASLWTGFIDQVAARYRGDPAVAFYSIEGEPAPPATSAQLHTLVDFYRTTSQALRAADPNHLITVGGFNHMEDHPQIGWWQAIDALPTNDIVAVKTYSQHDLDLMPAIAAYGRSVGKPVVDEEFGMPQGFGDGKFAGGSPYNGLDGGRAAFFASVYSSGRSLGFAGFIFWNMGCQKGPTSYEISPSTPVVWSVLVRYAAVSPPSPALPTTALCA
jgi:hypothetical protein